MLKNYQILRIGETIDLDKLTTELKKLLNEKSIPKYPYLTRFYLRLKIRPILQNVGFSYSDLQIKQDDLIIEYPKFQNVLYLHKAGKAFILTGLAFKLSTLILQKFLKIK